MSKLLWFLLSLPGLSFLALIATVPVAAQAESSGIAGVLLPVLIITVLILLNLLLKSFPSESTSFGWTPYEVFRAKMNINIQS